MINKSRTRSLLSLFALVVALGGCTLTANQVGQLVGFALPSGSITPQASVGQATASPVPTVGATATPLASQDWSDQQLYDIAEERTIQVYEKVSPSVVHITSQVIAMDFFGGMYPSEGTGSGFVFDTQGHIVTNYHVIEQARTVEVTLWDQTTVKAEIVGADPLNDLAVLKIDVGSKELHPVDMSFTGDLKVGQRAIAIGNPFGLDWTLTAGVISSLGRPLQVSSSQIIYDVVQTDAAINPGNSGGPLLNSHGQLIGVNAAIRSGAENIGFAIPLSTVRRVVPELIANGRYRHPWLGALGYSLTPELADSLKLPVSKGVLIARIYQGSPAAQGGLRGATQEVIIGNRRLYAGGDILVEIDGVPIPSNDYLYQYLETKTHVGQEITIKYYRGDQLLTTKVRLAESNG